MPEHRAQLRILTVAGAIALTAAWGCASVPKPGHLADPVIRRAATDSTIKLLDCVHEASGRLGYRPPERAIESRFRRVDATGNDGQWFVTEIGRGAIVLIAESWVDSTARPQLFVTAYETDYGRIVAVEPGVEKNRRLGARLQASPAARRRPLSPDVTADLAEIRSSCGTPAS